MAEPASDADTREGRALLMHPVTQEVYEIPKSALSCDALYPVTLRWDLFQRLGNQGCLTAEKFFNTVKALGGIVSSSNVLVVRLKDQADMCDGGEPMYVWASRMRTVVPDEDIFPEHLRGTSIGGEFVWMWTLSTSYQAWLDRFERRRTDPDIPTIGIDERVPTIRYVPAHTGLRMGPEDLNDAKHVPYNELTPSQRLFISSIKPQQTKFQRRAESMRWSASLKETINTTQYGFDDNKGVSSSARKRPFTGMYNFGTKQGDWTVRKKAAAFLVEKAASEKRNRFKPLPHVIEEIETNAKVKEFVGLPQTRPASPMLLTPDSDTWQNAKRKCVRQLERGTQNIAAAKQRRWGELPHEILVRILCFRIRDGLSEHEIDASVQQFNNLRLVSKGVHALAGSFVGIQLSTMRSDIERMVQHNTEDIAIERSPATVGSRARALGLQPEHFLAMGKTLTIQRIAGWTLDKTPRIVPSFFEYVRLRRKKEKEYPAMRIQKPKDEGVHVYNTLVENLSSSSHFMNAHYYLRAQLDGAEAYDEQLKAAGESDISELMLTSAGV